MDFRITEIARTTVEVPFANESAAHMQRELPLWGMFEILRVRTNVGLVGVGETMLHYSRSVQERVPEDAIGKNPHDLLYMEGIGDAMEMAVWDLAAQHAGVPLHALFGAKVRDAVPIAWWCIDMKPQDWASQARRAIATGYTDMQLKGRPWWDIIEQVQAVCEVLPSNMKIDVDFNGFLLDTDGALPVLHELEEHPNVVLFETPIPQSDVAGNARLRSELRSQIAHHFGDPAIPTVVREGVCDGFVIGGPVQALLAQGHTAAALDMPFWLPIVGTGITTAWATHLGAALTHATWPAITCLNIYESHMIDEPI